APLGFDVREEPVEPLHLVARGQAHPIEGLQAEEDRVGVRDAWARALHLVFVIPEAVLFLAFGVFDFADDAAELDASADADRIALDVVGHRKSSARHPATRLAD